MINITPISDSDAESLPRKGIVRKDLRESAFKRYEPFIAAAAKGSYKVNLRDNAQTLTLSVTSFVARMRDAMLAWEKFKYPSKLIPEGFNRRLVGFEIIDESNVLVTKLTQEVDSSVTQRFNESLEDHIIEINDDNATKVFDGITNGEKEYTGKQITLICKTKKHLHYLKSLEKLGVVVHLVE